LYHCIHDCGYITQLQQQISKGCYYAVSGGVLAWLSVWTEMQTRTWSSWCHCHSPSLASVKSRLVVPFWYQLTRVVPEKGPLNGCVCVCYYVAVHRRAVNVLTIISIFLISAVVWCSHSQWWVNEGVERGATAPPSSVRIGENNEKTDTVDIMSIHSANIASSIKMQRSHETMFAVVIYKICRQLIEAAFNSPTPISL